VTIRLPAALAAITGLILLLVLGSLVEGGLLTTLALILIVTGSLGLIYTLLLQADAQSRRASRRPVDRGDRGDFTSR